MTQNQFDKDLLVTGDDTLEDLIELPEQEEGYEDNPIRIIFEHPERQRVRTQ
jgi:hypothetical protein